MNNRINLKFYNKFDNSLYIYLQKLRPDYIDILKQKQEHNSEIIPFAIKYFSNNKRKKLLDEYNFKENAEILEINPCFGELTEVLCQKAQQVITLDFSKQNSEILDERLKKYNNLKMYVGNINDVIFEKKFDYIIANDILAFSAVFFKTEVPIENLFKYLKQFLKPDGELIIIDSNMYGIKNWSGAPDEHTGAIFDKLLKYPKNTQLESFIKDDIETALLNSNFKNIKFYYPIPSHYAPELIISEKDFANTEYMLKLSEYFKNYTLRYTPKFDESIVIKELILDNSIEMFLNSFLIVAKQ